MRRFALLPALGLVLTMVAVAGKADPPQGADPSAPAQPAAGLANLVQPASGPDINAAFAVTTDAGLWMICAASYQGPDAPELANKLCTYLRAHRYSTYVFNRGNEERKQLQEELDRWQREHPNTVRRWRLAHMQEEQLAVLIGGFKDVDAASAELKKVRKLDLPDIKLSSGKPAFDTYDAYEQAQGKKGYELKRYAINPFHTAFVIRNPTVPQERKQSAKADPLWKKLNSEEPRSLYKCPKPWTLVVQEYTGAQVIQPANASGGFLEKLGFNDKNLGKRLDQSAAMAQELCDMLRNDRRFGLKSYVLHTRYSSVVTVGEFDGPKDPGMQRVREQLKHFTFKNGKTGETTSLLFANPVPMEVPR
jgi:hypothetical protein